MSFGTRIRVTDRKHPDYFELGVVVLACANDRYVVAIERIFGQRVAKVLRADQLEVLP